MPLLGEAPITVYMEKKSRANPGAGTSAGKPALKKRKIDAPERPKDNKRTAQDSQGNRTLVNFFSPSNASVKDKSGSLRQNPSTPSLPNTRIGKAKNAQQHLLTPPMTTERPSRLRKSTLATTKPTLSSINSSEQTMSETRSASYPTPLTIPRHSRHSQNLQRDDETPCKPTGSHHCPEPVNPAPELSSQYVPSSQTQPELTLKSSTSRMQATSWRKDSRSFLYTRQDAGYPQSTADDASLEIVLSSQSQPPLSIPSHIKEHATDIARNDGHRPGINPISSEWVPSSQSQEIELTLPKEEKEEDASGCKMPSSELPELTMNVTTSQNISRTFSDEIFPVPIQYGLFDDIFDPADEEALKQSFDNPRPVQNVEEDSVTESDSQYEYPVESPVVSQPLPRPSTPDNFNAGIRQLTPAPYEGSQYPPSPRNASTIEHQSKSSPEESGYYASQEGGGSQEIKHFPSSFSQPAVASQESFSDSLPPDIRALFGNSQDSYPPDFPSSLR